MRFRSAALLDEVLARAEARRRPRTTRPWLAVRVAVHHVDALEREVRGLVEEEVDNNRAGEVARGEDEPVPEGDRLDDEGREEREEEVPEPVARRRERGLPGARACRERLADEDPDASVVEERLLSMVPIALPARADLRSPCHGVTENEETCRNDHHWSEISTQYLR